MDIRQELEVQRDAYARRLKQKAESLKGISERVLECLERGELNRINELGEVQALGQEVDVLCGKVNVLDRFCRNCR